MNRKTIINLSKIAGGIALAFSLTACGGGDDGGSVVAASQPRPVPKIITKKPSKNQVVAKPSPTPNQPIKQKPSINTGPINDDAGESLLAYYETYKPDFDIFAGGIYRSSTGGLSLSWDENTDVDIASNSMGSDPRFFLLPVSGPRPGNAPHLMTYGKGAVFAVCAAAENDENSSTILAAGALTSDSGFISKSGHGLIPQEGSSADGVSDVYGDYLLDTQCGAIGAGDTIEIRPTSGIQSASAGGKYEQLLTKEELSTLLTTGTVTTSYDEATVEFVIHRYYSDAPSGDVPASAPYIIISYKGIGGTSGLNGVMLLRPKQSEA
ncbi:hypothetical protein LGM14_27510 [Burkholderia multivorans]|nr:hypothetical protein [Burkholderia multivorans]